MIFIANFKANLTNPAVLAWIEKFNLLHQEISKALDIKVVICPSFISLEAAQREINLKEWKIKIFLGAQNVSLYNDGPYTGEVTLNMMKYLIKYIIVGHSERRKYFLENDEAVLNKVKIIQKAGLTPIVCVSRIEEVKLLKTLEYFNGILAYEPLFAVDSGTPDSPENVAQFIKKIKESLINTPVLYGGSINPENIESFTKTGVDGILVGKACLDPESFTRIIKNAS